jgi:hypothetical protein
MFLRRRRCPISGRSTGAQLHLLIVLAGVQRVEIRVSINAQDDRFAIDHELLAEGRFHDPRMAIGPVVAASGDQAHAVAVGLDDQAITVVLDLMEPVVAVRDFGRAGRDAGLEKSVAHAVRRLVQCANILQPFRFGGDCRARGKDISTPTIILHPPQPLPKLAR